jgi:hypothetical protein
MVSGSCQRMVTMKLISILLLATTISASAGTIEMIDPAHPSRDNPDEIIRINGGQPTHVHWKTFGSDKIAHARAFGISVQDRLDRDTAIWVKAAMLYPNDPFFQKAFYQFARNP